MTPAGAQPPRVTMGTYVSPAVAAWSVRPPARGAPHPPVSTRAGAVSTHNGERSVPGGDWYAKPQVSIFQRVLMVCTGNICRSPRAEVLLAQRLRDRGLTAAVESAGIAAPVGRGAGPTARALMGARNLDLGAHRARQPTPEIIRPFARALGRIERGLDEIEGVFRGRAP